VANGVDAELYREMSQGARAEMRTGLGLAGEFAWLAVGRFEVAKDYPNMLHAFARVREHRPDAVLLLAGRGSLQAETEALARDLGVFAAVRFLGIRADVPALLGAADGYVMSSAWEGLPMVLLEAAASGLPIVTTRVGGNAEAVRDGETGFLVPPREHEALASAMLRLMNLDVADRRRMGARGREHVRLRYGLARVVEQWEEVYRAALARRGITPVSSMSLSPAGGDRPWDGAADHSGQL
jgi:glycosyltransferase involved in cell wall biosynthesis